MNKLITRSICAAALSTLAIAPASAAPVLLDVDYSDLDIASPAGAEKLAQRVEAKLDSVCDRPFIRDLKGMRSYEECKSATREAVVDKLPQAAALTAI